MLRLTKDKKILIMKTVIISPIRPYITIAFCSDIFLREIVTNCIYRRVTKVEKILNHCDDV